MKTKIAIKSDKLTPFGGIFPIMEQFDQLLSHTIDLTLGQRNKLIGYQYSGIIRSIMCIYFCGGSCIEDVTNHLMAHPSLHPTLRTCSADTILRAVKEVTTENVTYISDAGKVYEFNIADKFNYLLINTIVSTGQLKDYTLVVMSKHKISQTRYQFINCRRENCQFIQLRILGLYKAVKAIASTTPWRWRWRHR